MNAPGKFKGIVFDLDGTLVDSIDTAYATYATFVRNHGGSPSAEQFERLNGLPFARVLEELRRALGIIIPLSELQEEYHQLLGKSYTSCVKLNPGVHEILEWSRAKGIKLAVATSAPSTIAEPVLANLKIIHYFQTIVTADRVRVGKPSPEPYLLAAKEIGLVPSACLAIEDSPVGLASASSAGMVCFAYQPQTENRRFFECGASRLIRHFNEVSEIIAEYASEPEIVKNFELVEPLNQGKVTTFASDEQQARNIVDYFAGAKTRNASLFDGEVVVCKAVQENSRLLITPSVVNYRELYGRVYGLDLDFLALAVSAVTLVQSSAEDTLIAVGKRSGTVTQFPNCWELVPSGSVSALHLREGASGLIAQLKEELSEEFFSILPFPAESLGEPDIVSLGAMIDKSNSVCDLIYKVRFAALRTLDPAVVESCSGFIGKNAEYDEVRFLTLEALSELTNRPNTPLVPTVMPILDLLRA